MRRIFLVFNAFLITVFVVAGVTYSEEKKPETSPPVEPPYERAAALKTLMNPHEQINDEGEILWNACLICHRNVPDLEKERSIRDVKLRFEDDLVTLCYNCHRVKRHPAAEGVSPMMMGFAAPLHLIVPPKVFYDNIRLTLKEVPTILPLDPKTGKIFCATCHNPHERGILEGRANWGADGTQRLRSEGLDVCQYCHRK